MSLPWRHKLLVDIDSVALIEAFKLEDNMQKLSSVNSMYLHYLLKALKH